MSAENMNTNIAPGDKASWSWGSGNPSGTVEQVQPHDITITTHRGNEVKKTGDEENPAVKLSLGGDKPAVKQASELSVSKPGPIHDQAGSATTMDSAAGSTNGEKKKENGLAAPQSAQGRAKSRSRSPAPPPKREEEKPAEKKEEPPKPVEKKEGAPKPAEKKEEAAPKPAEKKEEAPPKPAEKKEEAPKPAEKKKEEEQPKPAEKKDEPRAAAENEKKDETKADGDAVNGEKKKPGRKPGAAAKPKAERPKKRAATETGEPRRSKRNKES